MSAFRDLAGKVAVVTGGASGIGKGIATRLVEAGAHVVLADVEEHALQASASELGAVGIRTDVSDLSSVQALADATLARFGKVHVVCNNAGVGPFAKIADLTMDDWQWMLGVNLWGVVHGVHVFLPLLLDNAEGGHIVNTASAAGLVSVPELGAYCVTKFGVVALTETLAAELAADGARVGATVLCPGFIRTSINRSTRNRPVALAGGGLADVDLQVRDVRSTWMEPEQVGTLVVEAITRGDLYVMTHPDMLERVERRHEGIVEAFRRADATVP
jgi:NAD(P)-dependent dehydrogenase (short-subunit alcohol dehydrogenase family)